MKAEYLIFNLIIILGPVLAVLFYKKAKKLDLWPGLKAIIIPALLFIIWDELVTGYFWQFNDKYILGLKIFRLPIEEILFFFTVPWACLFLWVNLEQKLKSSVIKKLSVFLMLICFLAGFFYLLAGLYYTGLVLAMFFLTIIADILFKTNLLAQTRFIAFLGLVIIFIGIFNGYLTARPVVLYAESLKTNFNIYTIPIEDFIYGLALIILVIIFYEKRKFK